MADLFWLSDEQWAVIEPFMPKNQLGPERNDDWQVISGIIHVLKAGCRWCDCLPGCGPPTTIYNRLNRWSRRGFWKAMLAELEGRLERRSQYTNEAFQRLMAEHGVSCLMSRFGNVWDNRGDGKLLLVAEDRAHHPTCSTTLSASTTRRGGTRPWAISTLSSSETVPS